MYSACVSNEVKERERERGETKQFFHFFEISIFCEKHEQHEQEGACFVC